MPLVLIVVPIPILVILAVVSHSRTDQFWRACWRSSVTFAPIMLFYLIMAQMIFGPTPLSVSDAGRHLITASGCGFIGFFVAAVVGIPFHLDRLIQKHDEERAR